MTSNLSRVRWTILIVASLAVILTPQVFRFVPLPPVALNENRELAPMPKLPTGLFSLQTFFKQLNDHLQDSFPLRSEIIGGLNFVRYLAGYSAVGKVIVGRDGWLFLGDGAAPRWSPEVLSEWMRGLVQRLEYAKQHGIGYYVLPAPRQEMIYPEKLPRWFTKETSLEIDQIFETAREKGIDQIVDVRPALFDAKASRAVFGPFDIHWNGNGAYAAYQALMTRISRDYPDLAPLPQSSFKIQSGRPIGLALMLGVANRVESRQPTYATSPVHDEKRTTFLTERKDWAAPSILETDSTSNRTLLLIMDSFSSELIPLLKPHFRKMIVVHVDDAGSFRKDLIERYHPDIVIFESLANSIRPRMKPLL
jgi:alginate O-acetyltransferase complex protein AlgJ